MCSCGYYEIDRMTISCTKVVDEKVLLSRNIMEIGILC